MELKDRMVEEIKQNRKKELERGIENLGLPANTSFEDLERELALG